MDRDLRIAGRCVFLAGLTALLLAGLPATVSAQFIVPGTGSRATEVGDDFEEEDWAYTMHWPKASANLDKDSRYPIGESKNGRWYESAYRGEPDQVQRVATPEGGIEGSKGALLLRSLHTGVPGSPSYKFQQDDLLLNINGRLGGWVPMTWNPSIVVRVYVPPFEKFEQRTGTTFGFRADLEGTKFSDEPQRGTFFTRGGMRSVQVREGYWPGMFIQYNCKKDGGAAEDSAIILIRANELGHDQNGPVIKGPGWWTLGMSFTQDGRVHYFAKPGVEDLTAKDHLYSSLPYGFRADKMNTFFFNIVNADDGRTWSTPWIIDDPALYYTKR